MQGVHLTSLLISHFRSHRALRLQTDHRPVALVGRNGAGKTNVLEAVSLLSAGRGLRRASAEDMARRPEALGWKLRAEVVAPGTTHDIETWSDRGAARQVRIDDKASSQIALARIVRVLWLVPAMDRLWIEGAEGRRRFLDRMALSLFPAHGEAALAYEKAMRERNRLLRDQVRDAGWYGALEARMADAGHQLHQTRKATLAAVAAAQTGRDGDIFPEADLDITQSDGDMPETEEDLRQAFAESRFRDLAAGRTLVGPHRSDLHAVYRAKAVPAKECSTGEQKALLISLILANSRALAAQTGGPPLLLLDEVAAHLDMDRRAALYDAVCALGAQAWMTGTEPALFAGLGDRAQVLHVTDHDGVSEVSAGG